jgi:hypothetical protein
MTSLYQMTTDFRAMLDNAFDPETGEALPEFEAQRALIGSKVNQVAAYILNTELDIQAARTALKRIDAICEASERKAEHLRAYLSDNMKASGITEIKADDCSFVVKLFPDRDESVELEDGATFPPELCNDPKPPAPSKTKIKAAILAGQPVVGARIVRRDRLQIK